MDLSQYIGCPWPSQGKDVLLLSVTGSQPFLAQAAGRKFDLSQTKVDQNRGWYFAPRIPKTPQSSRQDMLWNANL